MTKLTKTQRFILQCLDAPGHVPEPKGRYTLSLRILEERGLVGHSMSHGWYIKQAGRAVLEEVTMSTSYDEAEIARLTRERDDLREALHAMMSAVLAFQNDDARRPGFSSNPYNCPMPWQGEALLKAYDLASIARANSPINADKETGG